MKNSSNSSIKKVAGGNTRTPAKKGVCVQISPSKHWCFTLNNFKKSDIDEVCSISSMSYVFQVETGENGVEHLQGYIEFAVKLRPKSLGLSDRIHWEKCKHVQKAKLYCQKKDTRTGGQYFKNVVRIKEIKIIKNLRKWQQKIVDLVMTEADDRTINWYWEDKGNVGKSALVKYLCVRHNAIVCSGKAADMKYMISKYVEKHGTGPEVVIFDVPRTCMNYISYTGIEEIKNCCFSSSKYESNMVIIPDLHILCFANSEPDTGSMSMDRWKITEL